MTTVFLIGYEPPGWDLGAGSPTPSMERRLRRLMQAADVAAVVVDGWPIDKVQDVDGVAFVCVGHEHDGKIAVVRPWKAN